MEGCGTLVIWQKVKPPVPPKPKWALQTPLPTDLQNKVGSDSWSRSRTRLDLTSEQISLAATMPAAGILKKSSRPGPPPPPPPIVIRTTSSADGNRNNSGKPYVPPKPRRFLSRAAEPDLTNRIQFEEEEPTTEDSYDYKDIDLAAEIFDFTPFPPRPKPPRKRPAAFQNGSLRNAETVNTFANANGMLTTAEVVDRSEPVAPVMEDGELQQNTTTNADDKLAHADDELTNEPNRPSTIVDELSELERERWEIYGTDNLSIDEKRDDVNDVIAEPINNIAGTNLAKFLKEHEGRPLSMEDVQRLENLLDEAEDEEEKQLEFDGRARLPSVRFGEAEILEGMTDDEDRLTADYSDVEFHHDVLPNGVPRSNDFVNEDNGTYEPVGPPDMRLIRPDLSSYKPPVPSTVIEDPFSWRRQGRRRYCSYGYDNQGIYSPGCTKAADKIMEGCQELEDRIVARDLSPPGTLLDILGRDHRKHRQKRIPTPPSRPPPPIPPKLRTPSPIASDFGQDGRQSPMDTVEDGEKPIDEDMVLSKLESEIVVEHALNEQQVNGVSSGDDLVANIDSEMPTNTTKLTELPEVKEVEEVICKSKALQETGADVETAASVFQFIDNEKYTSVPEQADVPETDTEIVCASENQVINAPIENPVKRPSRRDDFDKGWRPERPPPPKPQRPLRHKRFRSADPLPTRSQTQTAGIQPLRKKPMRSESFHTAEDVRRRIDIQAQQFLRTPRKKDLLSPTYISSSSCTSYASLGRPRTPVYSLVNKNMSRKKVAATSSTTDLSRTKSPLDGRGSVTPPIPPPLMSQNEDGEAEDLETSIDPLVREFNEWAAKKRLETFTDEDDDTAARKYENADEEPGGRIEANGSTTPATRPLPAPPAPPRHKVPKGGDKEDVIAFPSGVSVVFCGLLPKGASGGHMAVVPEMKVMRLTVGQLDASILRVSQVEADVLRANKIEDSSSRGPIPGSLDLGRPPSGGGGEGGASEKPDGSGTKDDIFDGAHSKSNIETTSSTGDKICDSEGNYLSESAEASAADACPTVISLTGDDLNNTTDDQRQFTSDQQPILNAFLESKHVGSYNDQDADLCPTSLSQDTTETENFVSFSSGNNRDSWSCDRDGRDSPFNTVTSTTSESASYVTCDETLHDGMGLTDDLDDDPIEADIDFVLDDDGEGTGCPTPTELEMDITLEDRMDDLLVDDDDRVVEVDKSEHGRNVEAPDVPLTLSHSVFYTDAGGSESLSSTQSDKSNSGSLSSSSDKKGIVKPITTKHGRQLANSTTSWYVDDVVTGNDDRNAALVSSGLTAKSNGTESTGCSDVGGTLVKRRIAELRVPQSYSTSTFGSGGDSCRSPHDTHTHKNRTRTTKCRHRQFDVTSDGKETIAPSENATVSLTSSKPDEENCAKNNDSCFPVIVVDDQCNCLEQEQEQHRLSESSSEDEDQESEASSPRNLSLCSNTASTSGGDETDGIGSGQRSRAFYIAQELMSSEKVFVDVLNLLTKDFRAAVDKASEALGHPIIPDEFFFQILDCLPQLRCLNEDLLKDLEERIEKWDEIGMISDVIVCKGPFLKLYTMYIKKFPVLTHNLDEACRRYPQFLQTVRDFELSDRCKKLELRHYMLKPVQRIPQYRMLLQDYLKNIDPNSPDYANTEAALMIVAEVASHANETMKEGDKFAKLMQIQSRISGNYEILKPGRTFIKEGELLKLCRKEMQPRLFILFSDSLLHLSTVSQGLLRIHHELPLSNMKVSVPTQEDFQNEFSVISVTRSFTLSASSPQERDEWISDLTSAIRQMVSRHASFVQAKLHQLNIPEYRNKSETLGQQAPVWIPDSRVTMCQLCVNEFTLTFRRHHCRACGKVVCSVCSANRAPLFYLNYETARVCDECFAVLHKEIEDRVSGVDADVVLTEHSESNGNGVERFTSGPKLRNLSLSDLKAQFKKYYRSSESQKHKRQLPKVLKEVCANDAGSSMSGYLYKKVKRTWKRQWFVIKDKVLYTYRASEDVAALDSTPLLGFHVVTFAEPRDRIHQQLVFELRHPGYPSMEFYAESLKSAKRWLEAVREATVLE